MLYFCLPSLATLFLRDRSWLSDQKVTQEVPVGPAAEKLPCLTQRDEIMKFNQHWRAVLAAYHSLQGERWKFLPALCCHINKYWWHWLTETSYSMKTTVLHSWDPGAPSPGGTRGNFLLISWICRPSFNLTTSKFIQGNTAYQVLPRNQVFQITFRSLTL